jgi:exopolysaccharide biosynthesis protein
MEALGVDEAVNLDGGGSSVMVLEGKIVNSPSDPEGERPVVNALGIRRDPGLCPVGG